MKTQKFKNFLSSFLNVAVIAGILAFIVIGLWRIELLEAPEFVNKLFSTADGKGNGAEQRPSDFLSQNSGNDRYEITRIDLDADTVRKMLEEVEISDVYTHDFQYTLYSDKNTVTKRIAVIRKDDLYFAYFATSDGTVTKQTIQKDGITTVNTLNGNNIKTVSYNSGNIDFSEQIGAVFTHKDFLENAENPEYTYSLNSGDDGTVMNIEFSTSLGEYTQTQSYKLNLDYGLVTEAKCYEGNDLIYSLSTNSISDSITTNLNIPPQFTDYLSKLTEDTSIEAEVQAVQE